ncbi:MAG: hypothetical protein M0R80_25805 [Proteobacteria bacterium]|jgi:hypothetical protein|nr:hypothetical protein [Pseudomonadota bacterium]
MPKTGLFDSDKLLGDNIIAHMTVMREANETVKNYYYSVSKLWRAVQEYLFSFGRTKGKNFRNCALIDWPKAGERVHCYNSCYGISLHRAHLAGPEFTLVYECSITFDCDEDTPRCHHDCNDNPIFEQTFDIVVPKEREINFNQKAFDAWIKQEEKKKAEAHKKQDLKELARLKKLCGEK